MMYFGCPICGRVVVPIMNYPGYSTPVGLYKCQRFGIELLRTEVIATHRLESPHNWKRFFDTEE